ncbi:MAG: hypothetical protein FWH36_05280 [Lentimicrobiaceae bacterium]|nr:hypothetical protein [Lentimicrobiaceae bacterium]
MNMNLKAGIFLLSLIILACTSEQTGKTTTKGNNQSFPDFTVEFPETEYKVEKTEQYDKSLGVLVTNWVLQGATENRPFMFFVAHNIVPEKLKSTLENPISFEIALKAMLTGSATKLGGTDFSYTKITYKNYKGIESICSVFDGNGLIKSRIYLIENNLFMVSAGGKDINIETVDKFLNSFEVK